MLVFDCGTFPERELVLEEENLSHLYYGAAEGMFFCVSYVTAVGLCIWYFGSSPNVLQSETIISETYISCSS